MWSLKVAPNSEFSRSASVRREAETRVMGIRVDIGPRRKKERAGGGPPLQKPTRSKRGKWQPAKSNSELSLLRGLGFDAVVGQREARFVAVGSVLVQHVLSNSLIDCRHRGLQKIARSGGVARGDRGAQTAHHGADPGAVGAVDLGALKRLHRALQNGFLLLLNFGSLSLGHLLLLCVSLKLLTLNEAYGFVKPAERVKGWSVSDYAIET